jgi:hypothetical protein
LRMSSATAGGLRQRRLVSCVVQSCPPSRAGVQKIVIRAAISTLQKGGRGKSRLLERFPVMSAAAQKLASQSSAAWPKCCVRYACCRSVLRHFRHLEAVRAPCRSHFGGKWGTPLDPHDRAWKKTGTLAGVASVRPQHPGATSSPSHRALESD